MRAMNIAATGMQAQQTNVEVISNNIANMNTTAYNRRLPEFTDLLYQNLQRVGTFSSDNNTIVPSGIQLGLGVKTASVYRATEQGSLSNTNNTLDLAVQGKGYFQIQLPNGSTAYTRDGTLALSAAGQIVTAEGYTVLPGINIPSNALSTTINSSGQVSVTLDGQTTATVVGQLNLANFPNEAGLEAEGNNLFLQTASSGAPITGSPGSTGFGTILQGYLEQSNVNVVSEVTNMISAQRAYEMNSKVIQTTDSMMQTTSQLKS
ncbi:flagellar basal-body rod protein FlgG [Telmatospirillum siberiense]|uniref:Flagellar basal-body rod protein FlgG n=1 Tax=Telmatospirillum siberiense TaxID=382514 RepID=A0A2N3Q070_9PROT|nr:flagellar basal-body rod protein FlgG [Telmatospirillum siberiense]PKU26011.1 flagellar basal-body rod protein FlgG [Telmatospirillum siberiense]